MIHLRNIFICALTFGLVFMFLYSRINRKFFDLTLDAITINKYHPFFLTLFLFSIGFLLLLLISLIIQRIVGKKKFIEQPRYLQKFAIFICKIDIFYKTYGIIFDYLSPNYTIHLIKLPKHFLTWKRRTHTILILLCVTLPRFVIAVIFCYEIYQQHLHYYFYSLLLLFIPLLFRFLVFILRDIGPRIFPEIKQFLDVDFSKGQNVILETQHGVKNLKAVELKFIPEYQGYDLDHFLETMYYPLLFIGPEMTEYFNPKYSKISIITSLIYLSIHAIGWFVILYVI